MTATATAVTATAAVTITTALTDRVLGARRPLLCVLPVHSAVRRQPPRHIPPRTPCQPHATDVCSVKWWPMRPLLEPEWTSVTAVTNQGPREWCCDSWSQATKAGRPPLVSLEPFTRDPPRYEEAQSPRGGHPEMFRPTSPAGAPAVNQPGLPNMRLSKNSRRVRPVAT